MVHSRTQAYLANILSPDIKKPPGFSDRPEKESKYVNREQIPTRRRTLGAEEMRLSRVDVRGRQQKFEKMANHQQTESKPHLSMRSKSEDNGKIKEAMKSEKVRSSESVDRINEKQAKKKMEITAVSSKRKTFAEGSKSAASERKQDLKTPKALVHPLKREPVNATERKLESMPSPEKEKHHLVDTNVEAQKGKVISPKREVQQEHEKQHSVKEAVKYNVVSVKRNGSKVEEKPDPSKNKPSTRVNEEIHNLTLIDRSKSPSMTISVSGRDAEDGKSNAKKTKAIIRVNSKASEKSENKTRVHIRSADSVEKATSPKEKGNRSSYQTRSPKESREMVGRNDSISSYYRDVRENLSNRKGSTNSRGELVADIMSLENNEMAKALGLSEELIELIKEEEKFWNRQVELKKWRESQEDKYWKRTSLYDTAKEKRIAELRREHETKKTIESREYNHHDLSIENIRLADEEFLARKAEQLVSMRTRHGDDITDEKSTKSVSPKKQNIYLKQYSLDEAHRDLNDSKADSKDLTKSRTDHKDHRDHKDHEDRSDTRYNHKDRNDGKDSRTNRKNLNDSGTDRRSYSYPERQISASSSGRSRLSDTTHNRKPRFEYHPSEQNYDNQRRKYLQRKHQKENEALRHPDRNNNLNHRGFSSHENARTFSAGNHFPEQERTQYPTRSKSHEHDSNKTENIIYHKSRASSEKLRSSNYNNDSPKLVDRPRRSEGFTRETNESSRLIRRRSPRSPNLYRNGTKGDTQDQRTDHPGKAGQEIERSLSLHNGPTQSTLINHTNTSDISQLKNERVFSEQCDGKVRTYHVTSVAYRYSRASSTSSSNMRNESLEHHNSSPHIERISRGIPPSNETFDKRVKEIPIAEPTIEHRFQSLPTGWFSDDEDVFVSKRSDNPRSSRGCFSDDEVEYFHEGLQTAKAIVLNDFYRIRCVGCSTLIREKDVIEIEGQDMYWHISCFYCVVCGTLLSKFRGSREKKVRIINWKLHCQHCYSTNGDKMTQV